LQHAHGRGIVHRDLKPQQHPDRAPTASRIPWILTGHAPDQPKEAATGDLWALPAYMSPEQARGANNAVDHRADIHALGVILFELLTGRRPFRGERQNLLFEIIHDEAASPRSLNPDVPPDMEAICLKCLAKDPANRFASSAALADALDLALASGAADSTTATDWGAEPASGSEQRLAELTRMLVTLQGEHQLYRALVESLPLGVYRTDLSGRLTFVNEWFYQTIGCRPTGAAGWRARFSARDELPSSSPKLPR
jgi:serine/threonine protein kinase